MYIMKGKIWKCLFFGNRIDSPSVHIKKYKCTAKNGSNPIEIMEGFLGGIGEAHMAKMGGKVEML